MIGYGSRFDVKSGSEGPAWDPYGYDEYTLIRGGGMRITIHLGLSCWVLCDGAIIENGDGDKCLKAFEDRVGVRLKSLQRFDQMQRRRCLKCGGRNIAHRYVNMGYGPDEEIKICRDCD